eukprot:2307284-Pyramimonas_sp.AAC.1
MQNPLRLPVQHAELRAVDRRPPEANRRQRDRLRGHVHGAPDDGIGQAVEEAGAVRAAVSTHVGPPLVGELHVGSESAGIPAGARAHRSQGGRSVSQVNT